MVSTGRTFYLYCYLLTTICKTHTHTHYSDFHQATGDFMLQYDLTVEKQILQKTLWCTKKEGHEVNYKNVSREYKKEMLHIDVYLETDRMINCLSYAKTVYLILIISVSLRDTLP